MQSLLSASENSSENKLNEIMSTVQPVLSATAETLLNQTTTSAPKLPENIIRRANFIWPEDPIDEMPVK